MAPFAILLSMALFCSCKIAEQQTVGERSEFWLAQAIYKKTTNEHYAVKNYRFQTSAQSSGFSQFQMALMSSSTAIIAQYVCASN